MWRLQKNILDHSHHLSIRLTQNDGHHAVLPKKSTNFFLWDTWIVSTGLFCGNFRCTKKGTQIHMLNLISCNGEVSSRCFFATVNHVYYPFSQTECVHSCSIRKENFDVIDTISICFFFNLSFNNSMVHRMTLNLSAS